MERLLIIGGGLLLSISAAAFGDDKVDFARDIQPILAHSCYKCHAGSKHKGELKLDSVESIRKGGKEFRDKLLVPGKPDKSELYRCITLPKDDEEVMPPDGKGDPPTKAQLELIKKWISQGADFGTWKVASAG